MGIELKINLILLVVGSFLGLTLSVFLLTVKSSRSKANLFLGTYLFLFAVYFFIGVLYRFDWLKDYPHIVHLQHGYEVLAGALTYLYVRACTEKNFRMKPLLWLHFLPLPLVFLYLLPWLMQSGAEKIAYYENYITNFVIGTPEWLSGAKMLLSSVYFVLSFRLIAQYKKHLSEEASNIDVTYQRWLLFFTFTTLLPVIAIVSWVIFGGSRTLTTAIIYLIFSVFFTVYIFVLLKPRIFQAFPNQITETEAAEKEKRKYESSNLQTEKKDRFTEKLLRYMDAKQPHLRSDLTLSGLAEEVDIPAHYLSQVINERMNCSFLDFVNGYRVQAAQKMLTDEKYNNLTVVAIAYEAGFNSKSAFYTAFKKKTGMTPSAFKRAGKSEVGTF